MASSRIFVRGLPPNFGDEEFRRHFSRQSSQQIPVTDTRIFPERRIGFVGYKTPEDAAKAVKYFNKSYIRLSCIQVELAEPLSSNANSTKKPKAPKARKAGDRETAKNGAPNENHLKRKRSQQETISADPNLNEFLEATGKADRTKMRNNDHVDAPATVESNNVPKAEIESEYWRLPGKKGRVEREAGRRQSQEIPKRSQPTDPSNNGDEHVDFNRSKEQNSPARQIVVSTDADWLRSRTSRLLGLEDDEDNQDEGKVGVDQATPLGASENESPVAQTTRHGDQMEPIQVTEQDPGEDHPKIAPSDRDIDIIRKTARLFVRNLSYSVAEDDLQQQFAQIGQIEEVHVPIDADTGQGKGFAYIQFKAPEDAVRAFLSYDNIIFQGRLMHILPASSKRTSKLDEFTLSKLPLKKQNIIRKRMNATTTTFNWNSLYMNSDAVLSSVSSRLGVSKSNLLDPTSADAAVKQAQAETYLIQSAKRFFAENGVDIDAFKRSPRGDTAILVKNFPYETKSEQLRRLFEEHGQVTRFLIPPFGIIAIVEFAQAPHARAAFAALAYRKVGNSILYLEKAPKDLFTPTASKTITSATTTPMTASKLSATDLLENKSTRETLETSTLFVRNLNFSTTQAHLTELFQPLSGFISARIRTKPDPKQPGQTLSMGSGFLEFRTAADAHAALTTMNDYVLDGHALQLRASHKGADAAESRRRADTAKRAAARSTRLIIKNLPFEASRQDIRSLLSSYGQLRSVRLPKKFDDSSRGFAFAEFTTAGEAENAMDALRDTHLLGRRLVLEFAAADAQDPEEELERMQVKAERQVNTVAVRKLTEGRRKRRKFVGGQDGVEGGES